MLVVPAAGTEPREKEERKNEKREREGTNLAPVRKTNTVQALLPAQKHYIMKVTLIFHFSLFTFHFSLFHSLFVIRHFSLPHGGGSGRGLLLKLPLEEPTLAEGEADIYLEDVLCGESCGAG